MSEKKTSQTKTDAKREDSEKVRQGDYSAQRQLDHRIKDNGTVKAAAQYKLVEKVG